MSLGALHTHVLCKRLCLPEFLDLSEAPINLVAHRGHHIVDGDHRLFVEQGLRPDFGVYLVALLEVVSDVVCRLCNLAEFLRPVDVEARLSLS